MLPLEIRMMIYELIIPRDTWVAVNVVAPGSAPPKGIMGKFGVLCRKGLSKLRKSTELELPQYKMALMLINWQTYQEVTHMYWITNTIWFGNCPFGHLPCINGMNKFLNMFSAYTLDNLTTVGILAGMRPLGWHEGVHIDERSEGDAYNETLSLSWIVDQVVKHCPNVKRFMLETLRNRRGWDGDYPPPEVLHRHSRNFRELAQMLTKIATLSKLEGIECRALDSVLLEPSCLYSALHEHSWIPALEHMECRKTRPSPAMEGLPDIHFDLLFVCKDVNWRGKWSKTLQHVGPEDKVGETIRGNMDVIELFK